MKRSRAQRSPRQIAWRLFVTCWLIYSLHFATNIVREIYPAITLGDHLSFNVYEYLGLHPDIFQPDPKIEEAYINNNPGASIVGALPFALSRPLIDWVVVRVNQHRATAGPSEPPDYGSHWPMAKEFFSRVYERGLDVKLGLAAGAMQVLAMAPLSALSAVVMFYLLLGLMVSRTAAQWLAILYAFATPVFFRTAQLNQNMLICHAAFFAFALLSAVPSQEPRKRLGAHALAGFLCGWSVVCDFSGLVVLLVLSGYGLYRWRSQPHSERAIADLWSFTAGVLLSALVLLGYQWSSFGNPFFPAQHYMPTATYSHMGFAGMDRPRLDLLGQTAFGLRYGLFTSAPLLILALYPPAWSRRVRIVSPAALTCIASLSVLMFVFCAANQYGRMQFNTGVRHIVPLSPFLFLIAAGVLLRMRTWMAILAGVLGTYWSWCLAMYREVELGLGVLEPILAVSTRGPMFPWLMTLERMPQFPEWVSNPTLAPLLLILLGGVLWVLWRRPREAKFATSD